MKRYLICILSLLSVLTFSQCQKSQDVAEPESSEGKVHISFTQKAGTDKCLILENGGAFSFLWESSDRIFVYDGTKYCGDMSLKTGAGTTFAVFEGDIKTPSGTDIYFYHLGNSIPAPSEGNEVVVDFYEQDGTKQSIQNKLIASCKQTYSSETKSYSGTLNVAYAIAKFDFSSAFPQDEKIGVRGVNQKIKISAGGVLSMVMPTGDYCSEIDCNVSEPCYVIIPADNTNNKISILGTVKNKIKVYNTAISSNTFYTKDGAGASIVVPAMTPQECTITYMAATEDDATATVFATDGPFTDASRAIIASEPKWKTPSTPSETYRTFLGWSTTQDGAAVYSKSGSSLTDAHSIVVTGSTSKTLYAVWSEGSNQPWIDFQHPTTVNFARFVITDDYVFNEHMKYDMTGKGGYERLYIPIYNLIEGQWYSLDFSESMTKSSGNWWTEGTGAYGCAVRETIDQRTSGLAIIVNDSQPNDGTNLNPYSYVWVHQERDHTNTYSPTSEATIIFKATSSLMYWCWDCSKIKDGTNVKNTISVVGNGLKKIKFEPTQPYVDFLRSSLIGFWYNRNYSDNETKGDSTYKKFAENNGSLVFRTLLKSNFYPKVNIPLMNLTVGKKYALSFTYDRDNAQFKNSTDFCYGISESENTDVTSTAYAGTTGYSANNKNNHIEDTIVFEATATTMYWVWSVGDLKNETFFKHNLVLNSFGVLGGSGDASIICNPGDLY